MNANFQQLEFLVNQNNGHLYDYGKDGVIVTNLSGKEMLHLPTDGECGIDPQIVEQVKQFFADLSEQQVDQDEITVKPITWIDINVLMLSDSKQMTACVKAIVEMAEHYSIVIKIHFDKDPIFWQDLLSPFIEPLRNEIEKGTVKLQLHGTFSRMKKPVMDFLFDNRIQIYYVSKAPTSKRNYNNICSFAEYGFRVPCVWYVDKKNINLIPALISEAMEWNYDAGFSLPLTTERVVGLVKNNPSNVAYLRLILDIYKKYQCYDDVFYPMNMALLESIGVTRDSKLRTWRWNNEHSSFYEYIHDSSIEKIHKMLRHSFIWQRHIVKNKFETLLLNVDLSTKEKNLKYETSDSTAK
jgi:hypothetical protein